MSQTIRQAPVLGFGGWKRRIGSSQFDEGRSVRRNARLYELDKDYQHQLKRLNKIVQRARSNYMELTNPKPNHR